MVQILLKSENRVGNRRGN